MAGVQRALAVALENQVARLRALPAALEATLRRSTSPAKARKTTEKKVARSSTNRAKVSKPGVQSTLLGAACKRRLEGHRHVQRSYVHDQTGDRTAGAVHGGGCGGAPTRIPGGAEVVVQGGMAA